MTPNPATSSFVLGPMPLTGEPEPPECSTVVAENGTGTYRRGFIGWSPAGRDETVDWATVQARLSSCWCWVVLPRFGGVV